MKLIFVRHGEPDYSIDSLTPKGWREAELLVPRLEKLQDPDVFCSPKGRAVDTARATLKKTGWSMEILPWLAEFRGMPDPTAPEADDCSWDLPPRFWTKEPRFYDPEQWMDPPFYANGTVREIYVETAQGIDGLLARYGYHWDGHILRCEKNTDKTLLLFCHFGITAAICGYLLNISPAVLWHTFVMLPTSVTTLVTEERIPGEVMLRCTGFGDTSHLYAADEPLSPAALFPEVWTEKNQGRVYDRVPEDE